jgi:uncharacterized FlaG/YvyC family protein
MREDSLKPFITGICSDIRSLHDMIKELEKENNYLRRKLEKLSNRKKQPKIVKVLAGNSNNNIEIIPHENTVFKDRLDKSR